MNSDIDVAHLLDRVATLESMVGVLQDKNDQKDSVILSLSKALDSQLAEIKDLKMWKKTEQNRQMIQGTAHRPDEGSEIRRF